VTAPWTEAHQREARRRCYELAAELAGVGRDADAGDLAAAAQGLGTADEERFRYMLAGVDFADGDIKRAVKRVRALAEGRLVRETVWALRSAWSVAETTEPWRVEAWRKIRGPGDKLVKLVKITRIRRAR